MVRQFEEKRYKESGFLKPVGEFLHHNHMSRLGISNSMRVAHAVNHVRFRREDAYRRAQYRDHFDDLLAENGAPRGPLIEMHDGWAMDTSMSLPHLDRMLADADQIIAERGGVQITPPGTYRSFFQDVWEDEDCERFGGIVDFATSSEVVGVICNYLRSIPVLSTTIPPGIRLVESNANFDDTPDVPKDSQLYHIDYYSQPNVYVLVLLRDTDFDMGPWSFVPKSVTDRAKKTLGYWRRGKPYRLDDSQMYSAADKDDMIELSYPRGTVLFIESSGCFHFGSRNAIKPRFQLMLGYSTIVRTDFSELFMKNRSVPRRPSDPRLRKMLFDKRYLGDDASYY
jgi:hypothetical protein